MNAFYKIYTSFTEIIFLVSESATKLAHADVDVEIRNLWYPCRAVDQNLFHFIHGKKYQGYFATNYGFLRCGSNLRETMFM